MSAHQHDVGTAAEEAVRLFAAAEEWVRARTGGLLDEDHLATGAPACTVCPLCQVVGAVRQVRPETVEHLLDAAASFVAALKATVAPSAEGPAPRGPRVERIDVQEG